jgi:hypothetical protein
MPNPEIEVVGAPLLASSNPRDGSNRRQTSTEAKLGFLNLPQQLRKAGITSPLGVVAVQLIEDTLAPAIQGPELLPPCEEQFVDNFRGAIEYARWIFLGVDAVQGRSFHAFLQSPHRICTLIRGINVCTAHPSA